MTAPRREPPPERPYSRAIPEPTVGPMVMALGVTLLFAGIVTTIAVSVVGLLLAIVGGTIWFRAVFPDERVEAIEATGGQTVVGPVPLPPREAPSRRLVLPVEIHPYRAGLAGGLAGGGAMAAVAVAWGIVEHGSVWLPINLLVGAVNPAMSEMGEPELAAFRLGWFALAVLLHGGLSLLTGLLFTVALPMMPRRPMLFGMVVVPIILSGLTWSLLGVVNPALERFIAWPWFLASQVAFGGVCGFVVSRGERVSLMKDLPMADRLGVERSGDGREGSR